MLRTLIYILGMLALHHTDLHHPDAFFRLFLPLVDAVFLIFIVWQVMFYFTLNNFTGDYGFSDMLRDVWDLRFDIQEQGLLPALFQLGLALLEFVLFFTAIFYYWNMAIALVSQ